MDFRYTVITAPRPVSKRFVLKNGRVEKQNAPPISTGHARIVTANLQTFTEQLKAFTPNQVLTTGVLKNGHNEVGITTVKKQKKNPDCVTRTREYFKFDPISLFPIDYDHGQFKSTQEFDAAMNRVILGFSMLDRVYRKSNSCSVFKDGQPVFNELKFHCYILLKLSENPETAIEQVAQLGKTILVRAWNAGLGYCHITKAGVVLDRCLVDVAILARPEGVMYEGRPIAGKGLECRDPGTHFRQAVRKYLDPTKIDPLTEEEITEYNRLSAIERERIAPEVEEVLEKYIDGRVESFTKTGKFTETQARKAIRETLTGMRLPTAWEVVLDTGDKVTVQDLLDDHAHYDGITLHDPLEADYGRCKAKYYYNKGLNPMIHSLAHGLSRRFMIQMNHSAHEGHTDGEPIEVMAERLFGFIREDEDGDAKHFIELHKGRFCYDHAAGLWYRFKGHYWEPDHVDQVTASVESIIDRYVSAAQYWGSRKISATSNGRKKEAEGYAKKEEIFLKRIGALHKSFRKANVLRLATAGTESLGIPGEQWDDSIGLLCCENGVVDLETGEIRPGDWQDFIKTVAPTEFNGLNEPCERWTKFLTEVFDGDAELIGYVHRLCGYAVTGKVTEHIFPIFYGIGRNGKDTFFETLSHVLGDLAGPVESELLLKQRFSRASGGPASDIIALRGKRIVWASETEEGRRFNISKLKLLTGGGALTGRPPYGRRQITFSPIHTLFLLTNHKPHAPADEYGFWKRAQLIPFTLSFISEPHADHERLADPELLGRLKQEASGILAWVVKGCLKWREEGLNPPETVRMATSEYQQEEDALGQFIDEQCIPKETAQTKAGDFYKAYVGWCKEMGFEPKSGKAIGGEMKKRFDSFKSNCIYYIGIGLPVEDFSFGPEN